MSHPYDSVEGWAAGRRDRAATDDRRAEERHPLHLRVKLSNLRETFRAKTVDVSRSGALFRIQDARFYRGGGDPLATLTRQVRRYFGAGLTVVFGGGVLRRRMSVVRTTTDGDRQVPLVACRFERLLTRPECTLLGIPLDHSGWSFF